MRDSSVYYLSLKRSLDTIAHIPYYVFLNTRKDTDSLVLYKFIIDGPDKPEHKGHADMHN
jgi:hypothetical protein